MGHRASPWTRSSGSSTRSSPPRATIVDGEAEFPSAAITALGEAGFLGLLSSTEVGGAGGGLREATEVVERLAGVCGSTAMVLLMHYPATAAGEAHGPVDVREAIAAGRQTPS